MRFVIVIFVGLSLLAFGLACCHFTKPSALAHHTQVAEENGWPPPSNTTLALGVAALALGAGIAGWGMARWQSGVSVDD